jgi:NAD(P)-dependent dehydrogenase (short-subunit alcohol dehydrogenase family)
MVGKVAIVTGVGRNIGEAIAERLARDGFRIAGADVDPASAQSVVDRLNSVAPDSAIAVACDVSRKNEVADLARTVLEKWGSIDVLVNNVAISDHSDVLELDEDEWDRVFAVSAKSAFLCTQAVAREMVQRKIRGVIVNIASTSAHLSRREATAYPASKAAVLSLTRTTALQLAPYGIRVNAVSPNRVGSPVGMAQRRQTGEVTNLVGRNGEPEDIASAVAFLVDEQSSFINGTEIMVDGGVMASFVS